MPHSALLRHHALGGRVPARPSDFMADKQIRQPVFAAANSRSKFTILHPARSYQRARSAVTKHQFWGAGFIAIAASRFRYMPAGNSCGCGSIMPGRGLLRSNISDNHISRRTGTDRPRGRQPRPYDLGHGHTQGSAAKRVLKHESDVTPDRRSALDDQPGCSWPET